MSTVAHGAECVRHFVHAKELYPKDKVRLAQKAYGLRGIFVVFTLVAEFILTLASKGHGNGVKSDKSVDETAYAIVADAILQQPAEKRDGLIKDLSHNFLANPDVLGGEANIIEAALRQRIANLAANPWMAPAETRRIERASDAQRTANWQEKQMQRGLASAEMAPAVG